MVFLFNFCCLFFVLLFVFIIVCLLFIFVLLFVCFYYCLFVVYFCIVVCLFLLLFVCCLFLYCCLFDIREVLGFGMIARASLMEGYPEKHQKGTESQRPTRQCRYIRGHYIMIYIVLLPPNHFRCSTGGAPLNLYI